MVSLIQMGAQAVASNKLYIHATTGCLMFVSAVVQANCWATRVWLRWYIAVD